MKKVLGLDLGTTSIGWAMVNQAESSDERSSIIMTGVRVNPLTTDEKDSFEKGKAITTNADRRLKRGIAQESPAIQTSSGASLVCAQARGVDKRRYCPVRAGRRLHISDIPFEGGGSVKGDYLG